MVEGPPEASSGLKGAIEGLLTRDPGSRLTLNQLRRSEWLTEGDRQPLPMQPMLQVEVSEEEIALAFTKREAVA